jgi:hypothetical protein
MAESNHDDLADALARLAGGDVAPSEREHDDAPPPPPPPKPPVSKPGFRPTPPAAARPPGLRPPSAAPRPAAPGTARPAAPGVPAAARPAPPAAPRPATPAVARPAAPAAPAVARPPITPAPPPPPARPQRPDVPTIARPAAPPNLTPPEPAEPEFANDGDDGAAAMAVDDDDAVIVPAPDASVFIPKKKPVSSAIARARVARQKRIDFRQTVIPVLLTGGALLIGFGVAPVAMGHDSVAAALPSWVTPTLVAAGLALWVLAVLNMLSVRSLMAQAAE